MAMPAKAQLALLAIIIAAATPSALAVPAVNRTRSRRWNPEPDCQRTTTAPPPLDEEQMVSRGPQQGTLIVAGGSLVTNSAVFQRLLQEAGGPQQAVILFVPTNGGGSYETPAQREASLNSFVATSGWGEQMATSVVLLHTYDRAVADSEAFYGQIDQANAVYFAGGLSFHSYDAYFGTNTQAALERLLARGGVIGGSSAGALMQSNLMLRSDRSRQNSIMLGDPQEGFAFGGMQNIVFDVHYLHRNRGFDMIEVINLYPDMLGISIDEDTAIVMKGDDIEVVGSGWVAIYDSTLWQPRSETPYCGNFLLYAPRVSRCLIPNHGKFYFLTADRNRPDRLNVRTREVATSSDFDDASVEEEL